jgi:proteasome lid subunit RPN8/RPN11
MNLLIPKHVLARIHSQAEKVYPEEGAGFLLGIEGPKRIVQDVISFPNSREAGARHNRYLLGPEEYAKAEVEAERRRLDLVGVFHSHPDHPNRPSEFDREWAQPAFSYVITSVHAGTAVESRSWRLTEDRAHFAEEPIQITD